ncbi:MAG TPA: hypothetical protein VIP77_18400 [Jiangellaceae bacterium]
MTAPDRLDPAAAPGHLTVRDGLTVRNALMLLTCVVLGALGAAMVVGGLVVGELGPAVIGIVGGLACFVLFGLGAVVLAGRFLARRPLLTLDPHGVTIVASWPHSRRHDRVLPWSELAGVTASTTIVTVRGVTTRTHAVAFTPAEAATEASTRLERWTSRRTGVDPATRRNSVLYTSGWNVSLAQLEATIRAYRPDLVISDQRELSTREARREALA